MLDEYEGGGLNYNVKNELRSYIKDLEDMYYVFEYLNFNQFFNSDVFHDEVNHNAIYKLAISTIDDEVVGFSELELSVYKNKFHSKFEKLYTCCESGCYLDSIPRKICKYIEGLRLTDLFDTVDTRL